MLPSFAFSSTAFAFALSSISIINASPVATFPTSTQAWAPEVTNPTIPVTINLSVTNPIDGTSGTAGASMFHFKESQNPIRALAVSPYDGKLALTPAAEVNMDNWLDILYDPASKRFALWYMGDKHLSKVADCSENGHVCFATVNGEFSGVNLITWS